MRSLKTLLLITAAAMVPAGAAFAQDTQTPPPAEQTAPADPEGEDEAEESAEVENIVVTGQANAVRTSIDSISYSVADDLQTTSGALADALRGVPSVEVDPEGNVTLRGDANVTILVDGRPSALFSGPSRGQTILQIPADQYLRIEVMTNPSAAYSPEGSGGIINLISKPTATRAGAMMSGSVRANAGNDGRYNLGGNIAWSKDKLTLTGDVGVRHDSFNQHTTRQREQFDAGSGQWLPARGEQTVEGESDSLFLRGAIEYRLDDRTQLSGDITAGEFSTFADAVDTFEAENAAGAVAYGYRRHAQGGADGKFGAVTARVLRQFDDMGHEWTNEIRFNGSDFGFALDTLADNLTPAAPAFYERIDNGTENSQMAFTSAYVRPFGETGKLRLGYELEATGLELDNQVLRGPDLASLTPDPLVSNAFNVDQEVHALYATYERAYGKLSAQYGLRLEQAIVDIDQVTTGVQDSNDYFRAYPTLHLSYQLSEEQTVRASYSRRIQRPQPQDLNPFVTYQDPLNYRAGNPDLEPQETDAFELMWQRRVQQTFYQATVYHRATDKAFTPVVTEIGGGVLLTRPENLGERTATGVELVANGGLGPKLKYQASVNVFHQEIDASTIPGGVDSSGETVSGRVSLNWTPTDKDFLQVMGLWTGEQLNAQGTREASTLVNLGYRRKLTDKLSLNVTVRDVFDDFGDVTFLDTPTLRDRTERDFGGRMAFIGLTWTFGKGPARPEQFDFAAPQTGQ